ncbi:MAG TPA: phosphotransferase [Acidisoma sp.]|uniref:phosphotransferase enzyme family protein n=1 Tax=Acidisoma sp. TaxID=1872115 RepID=UPI002C3206BB|nr:phosphotransferase [Acidisoma sp.]HTI00747.1 phosphotransferase [Acidisoma sp.]
MNAGPLYDVAFLTRLEAGVRAALPSWGVSEGAEVSLLTISENATYRVRDAATGIDMALRVSRPGYNTRAEIESELAWVQALRSEGVIETPAPVPLADGSLIAGVPDEGAVRYMTGFAFQPGAEPAADADLVPWFEELGAIHARLHAHARAWVKPPGFQRRLWTFETTLGATPHWGDWRAGLGLTPEGRAVIEQVSVLLEARLAVYGHGTERFGLVHADLRLANLLVQGERLSVIDFDDCGFCWYFYDFAAAISFLEHEPYIPALRAAWMRGYRRIAPIGPEDEAAIDDFVMLRRILLTAWIASHAETPTAQAMGTAYTDGTVALAQAYLALRTRE